MTAACEVLNQRKKDRRHALIPIQGANQGAGPKGGGRAACVGAGAALPLVNMANARA